MHMKHYRNYQLLKHNTFGIEAVAEEYIDFSTETELAELLSKGLKGNSFVIGGGSNLLFVNDFPGTVFHSSIMDINVVEEDENDVLLRVGSGVNWDTLVSYAVEKGWA